MGLLVGALTPSLIESIVRLGTWMPFVPVTKGLYHFLKVHVSEPTARRKTEAAGQAYVEVQTAEVDRLAQDQSDSPQDQPKGPSVQQLSVDGAQVPLVGKRWSEVKTLAIGTVGEPQRRNGELEIHTTELSYFSRLTDHETFSRLASVETYRRGTATAGQVLAINDGAVWEQEFVDDHRPDAVRILDFGHSAEHLGNVGQALYGVGTQANKEWLKAQCHELRHGDPDKVLAELRRLRDELAGEPPTDQPTGPAAEQPTGQEAGLGAKAYEVVVDNLQYLEKRREQILYADFEQAGYPIGSGAVESGNKLVVEARLKGAGMHWAEPNVDRMVALRNIACSDRWEEAWPQITERLRAQARARSAARRSRRREAARAVPTERPAEAAESSQAVAAVATTSPGPAVVVVSSPEPPLVSQTTVSQTTVSQTIEEAKPKVRRPAANHPWRHMPIGKARRR